MGGEPRRFQFRVDCAKEGLSFQASNLVPEIEVTQTEATCEVAHIRITGLAFVGLAEEPAAKPPSTQAIGEASGEYQLPGGQARQIRRGLPIALGLFIGVEEPRVVIQRLEIFKIRR